MKLLITLLIIAVGIFSLIEAAHLPQISFDADGDSLQEWQDDYSESDDPLHAIMNPHLQAGNPFQISQQEFNNAFLSNGFGALNFREYQRFVNRPVQWNAISSRQEMAMFLAQLLHESGGLQFRRELGCPQLPKCQDYQYPSWNSELCGPGRNQLCRTVPAPGKLYYGRGYMQLSWPVNYEAASWAIYGDDRLWHNPDLAAKSIPAWDTSIWYWKVNVHSNPFVLAGQFGASTRAINGWLECSGGGYGTELARKRFQIYQNVYRAFNLPGVPVESGCYN